MPRRKWSPPLVFALVTLASLFPLLVWDACPSAFPARAHDVLSATPLTLVALAYLVYQRARRAPPMELAKAMLSAAAFWFWAVNQLFPDHPRAALFNDLAIVAFVLDVVLVIVGWPPASDAEAKSDCVAAPDAALDEPG